MTAEPYEELEDAISSAAEDSGLTLGDPLELKHGEAIHLNKRGEPAFLNQTYFADRFAVNSGVIYEPDEHAFFLYDPSTGLWTLESDEKIMLRIGQDIQEYLSRNKLDFLLKARSAAMLRQILSLVRGFAERRNVFDPAKRRFIHCGNGVLIHDGEKWIKRPFSAEFYSRNRTSIHYDPSAGCPRFLKELLAPAMSPEDVELMRIYAGQCLIGYNMSQMFLMLTGTPGGGKSTLVNVIEGLIGRFNCTELRLEHMTERFELQRLIGKTLLTAKDVKSHFMNSPGAYKLKALTGNDTMTAEFKGGNGGKDITGVFNAIITSNTTLRVSLDGDSGAWRRRMLWIKYDSEAPKEKIADFDKLLLRDEGSGILNWALSGAETLLNNGGIITRTAEQTARIDNLLLESDSVGAFVSRCIHREDRADITIAEIMVEYQRYCDALGWEPVTDRQFQRVLPDQMLSYHRAVKRNDINRNGKNQKGYSGFCLIPVSDAPDDPDYV